MKALPAAVACQQECDRPLESGAECGFYNDAVPKITSPLAPRRGLAPALLVAALVASVFIVYAQTSDFGFIALDDDVYVQDNPFVQKGISWQGLRWSLTADVNDNWHPLVWVSFMADRSFLGRAPSGFHAVNVVLHAANTALLFLLLRAATGLAGRSAFVAALFGLHPLHVESVAWISERKDVLSTLFWLLALLSYVRWCRERQRRSYVWSLVFLTLGLLSKPMLVTVPVTMLILDFWPLGRFRTESVRRLVVEKVPFALLAAGSATVTLLVQHRADSPAAVDDASLWWRAAVAAVSLVKSLGRAVWPADLAVLYPFPAELPGVVVAGSVVLLAALTLLVLRLRHGAPFVLAGWIWFLVTWLPVSGLIPFGVQATADRFMYVPLIGLFVALAWAVPEPVPRVAMGAGIAVLGLLAALSYRQAGLWRDSETLFSHALAVTGDNPMIENNLGVYLKEIGRLDEALVHVENALRTKPGYPDAILNRGFILSGKGLAQEALADFDSVLRADPSYGRALFGRGMALAQLGRFEEAVVSLEAARARNPRHYDTLNNLGVALYRLRRLEDARVPLAQAIALVPARHEAYNNLGLVASALGAGDEAIALFRAALARKPDYGMARRNLAREEALRRPAQP